MICPFPGATSKDFSHKYPTSSISSWYEYWFCKYSSFQVYWTKKNNDVLQQLLVTISTQHQPIHPNGWPRVQNPSHIPLGDQTWQWKINHISRCCSQYNSPIFFSGMSQSCSIRKRKKTHTFYGYPAAQWIGLWENLHREPSFFPWMIRGFQLFSLEPIHEGEKTP